MSNFSTPRTPGQRGLPIHDTPYIITQNGQASMVIESVKQYEDKQSFVAALKIIALGEKDRLHGLGISAADSRAQLLAARQNLK